ncbi:hypothetical protein BBW65_04095 [Helicobacter enhydrae]|uniref:Glycosyltransferase 2-like domain-containing protein n=1 Tax=Helicobacter enhydrae TaxID=222136 RepID=A0A1B1U5Q7_9HELI|nr:glycosyltransferase family 2 protein [Helicobacter enhydrae]ANV98032.1 hypothetical protein BBW65_04095 [Helicobacter enhydrae]
MFSIVTVVYNDVSHILETIRSVTSQTYHKIEYILIDGWSNDGTKEAILEYLHSNTQITLQNQTDSKLYIEALHFQYPNLSFKFLSEKDEGIYDAMNKGIALATKEWINFMNCGDRFYDCNVLEKISKENISQYDVVYGDTQIIYNHQAKRVVLAPIHCSNIRLMFRNCCHQSFFLKTKIQKQYPFDLMFKIAADYNTIHTILDNKYNFKKIDIVIASFANGGASDSAKLSCTNEIFKIAMQHNLNSPIILTKIILFYYPYATIKRLIKIYLPKKILTPLIALYQKTKHVS